MYRRAHGVSGFGGGDIVVESDGKDFDAGVGCMGHCGGLVMCYRVA
jgi:hypothetical protein